MCLGSTVLDFLDTFCDRVPDKYNVNSMKNNFSQIIRVVHCTAFITESFYFFLGGKGLRGRINSSKQTGVDQIWTMLNTPSINLVSRRRGPAVYSRVNQKKMALTRLSENEIAEFLTKTERKESKNTQNMLLD